MGIGAAIAGLGSAVIGGIASNKASKRQAKAQRQATDASMMGFEYLQDNEMVGGAQEQGLAAQEQIGALMGLGGDQAAAQEAFDNYRDSTGYQFRLDQGMDAITGNRAASGLLNSGATLRGLNEYGQNMASQEFSDYLGRLGSVQGTGLESAYNVASSGASAGSQAAQIGMQGAARQNAIRRRGMADISSGLGAAVGGITDYGQNQGWWGD